MHAGEIHTDTDLVSRLIAAQFPQWASMSVRPVLSTGTDNAMYRLGEDMVVRLPRIGWAVSAVEREHTWLPQLAPLLPVRIPSPVAMGVPGEGYPYPWSVYRWIKGKNPVVGHLVNPAALAEDVAQFILAFRRIALLNGPSAARSGPLRMRADAVRTAMKELHQLVDIDAVTKVWKSALQVSDWSGPAVWVHSDLAPGNLLLIDEQLSAVIDFSGVGIGDPACDLPVAWNLFPADVRNAFRTALDVDDATWLRGRGWALAIALVQLPYYQHTNPSLAAGARRVISEILTE